MRTLRFKVSKQILSKNPRCDFSGLAPGTENYLQCKFSFDKTWRGSICVAEFTKRYESQVYSTLIDGGACMVPSEVLDSSGFCLRVVGQDDEVRLTTNKVLIRQGGAAG